MGCNNCGSSRLAGTKKFNLIEKSTSKVLKTYSSETEARMASSRTPGTTVRAA